MAASPADPDEVYGGVLQVARGHRIEGVLDLTELQLARARTLKREGLRASADLRNEKLGFKVREAELAKVPYMIVVGEREAAARSVSLRLLRGAKSEVMELEKVVELLKSEPLPG